MLTARMFIAFRRRQQTLSARALFPLGVALLAVTFLGAGCSRGGLVANRGTIVVWGAFDDLETMKPLIDAFQKEYRGVKVDYKKISPVDTYEQTLLRALAEGRGPDVFLVNAAWLPRWRGALLPAPEKLLPIRDVREEFVDVVAKDVISGDRVYALPLYLDTLALYYNKDILNTAGFARAPRTWDEVQTAVRRLTVFNAEDPAQIDRHGIALGAGRNVNRAADALSALMIQNGARLVDEKGQPAFGADPHALQALQFYTDFANGAKDVYTWNLRSDYSLDAFAEGEAAMMINYSYHRPTIRLKNARLNFDVVPLPQVEASNLENPPTTYANYWVFAVSKQSVAPEEAWEFVRAITRQEPSRLYLAASGYPPARRDLVADLIDDTALGVFARQSLLATTWRQPDNRVVDRVFAETMDAVVSGQDTVEGALRRAAEQITAAAVALPATDTQ